MKNLIAALSCLAFATSAFAQDAPKGPAPFFKVVTAVDAQKGLIEFKERVTFAVPVEKVIEVNVNGKIEQRRITETVTQIREETSSIEIAHARVITPDGKKVNADDLWKRVKANAVVVISANSDTPAPEFLRALHHDTVVVIPDVVPQIKQ